MLRPLWRSLYSTSSSNDASDEGNKNKNPDDDINNNNKENGSSKDAGTKDKDRDDDTDNQCDAVKQKAAKKALRGTKEENLMTSSKSSEKVPSPGNASKAEESAKADLEHRAILKGLISELDIESVNQQLQDIEDSVQRTIQEKLDSADHLQPEKTHDSTNTQAQEQQEKENEQEQEQEKDNLDLKSPQRDHELERQHEHEHELDEHGGQHEGEQEQDILDELEELQGELDGKSASLRSNLPMLIMNTPSRGSTAHSAPSLQNIPDEYPNVLCIPVTRRPLIPGFFKTLTIKSPKVCAAVQQAIRRGEPYIGVFLARDEDNTRDSIDQLADIFPIGTFAKIESAITTPPGMLGDAGMTFVVQPVRRIVVTELLTSNKPHLGYARVATRNLSDAPYDRKDRVIRALTQEIYITLADIAKINSFFKEHISHHNVSSAIFEDAGLLADFVAVLVSAEPHELQSVMDARSIVERLKAALVLLKKEFVAAQLQHSISKDIEKKFGERQKQMFLHEQLKAIKKQLGLEADAKDKVIEDLRARAARLTMPPKVLKIFEEELAKLSMLESVGTEFNMTRSYVDWLVSVPWGHTSQDQLDVADARRILDSDHYGLEDVKDRIVEFIAVSRLRGSLSQGKILCLVGPPGVGKTSVGKSIARALGRHYYRFSVGGLADVHEIKGHRRTYIGAMPGKIVQALKLTGKENPLILIDEIDKIGQAMRSSGGDPSAALLELLDPEQNTAFMDDYLDVPLDLSKVLFVCTANRLDTIPAPLLDRMEVIELSGYIAEEKFAIAKDYLVPQAMRDCGLAKNSIRLSEDVLMQLIKYYCREAGVRNLKKHVEKIFRKGAFSLVKDNLLPIKIEPEAAKSKEKGDGVASSVDKAPLTDPQSVSTCTDPAVTDAAAERGVLQADLEVETPLLIVDNDSLQKFVGKPIWTSERLFESTPPGVVMGLSVTSMGGAVLYLEAVVDHSVSPPSTANDETKKGLGGGGKLIQTGNLGKVMEESTTIAYTVAKSMLFQINSTSDFFHANVIHIHAPEGAVPKDGPSAGITIATSLLSLALNTSVKQGTAMTGELTLSGKVLRIGGLKEKTIAAKREGMTCVIFPKSNQADWEELPAHIKDGLTPQPVESFRQVFDLCFPTINF